MIFRLLVNRPPKRFSWERCAKKRDADAAAKADRAFITLLIHVSLDRNKASEEAMMEKNDRCFDDIEREKKRERKSIDTGER